MSKKEKITFEQFGQKFQDNLAILISRDSSFSDQIQEVLEYNYFEHKYLQVFVKKIFEYKEIYKTHPAIETIKNILKNDLSKEDNMLQEQVKEFFSNVVLASSKVEDVEYIKDKSLDFCKKQKLKEAMLKSIDLLQKSSFDEISSVINGALKLGTDNNFGHDYMRDFEIRYEDVIRLPISTGWQLVDNICQGGLAAGELGVIIAPTGCHAKGTKVVMYDGGIKNVEDVIVGDLLMGPDSSPREVLKLARGVDEMYKITPTKGDSFVVNKKHILSLMRYWHKDRKNPHGDRKKIEITVEDYEKKSKTFKHICKLYRSECIDFGSSSDLPLSPYAFGLLVGDGCYTDASSSQVSFTNMDDVLVEFISSHMKEKFGLETRIGNKKNTRAKSLTFTLGKMGRGHANALFETLKQMEVRKSGLKEKFIPREFLLSSRENRLELLAGLLDTDGYCTKKGYEIVTKFDKLKNDILFLCRSLGLAAYCSLKYVNINGKKLKYHRVSISGECSIIPCKVERKRILESRNQKKNWLVSGFRTEKVEDGEYFGFQLSGDHLYLLEDFTVMHNCGKSHFLVHLGAQALKQGKTVIHYTLELSDISVSLRYDSSLTNFPLTDIRMYKDLVKAQLEQIPGKLIVKEYPTKSVSLRAIRSHLDKLENRGIVPDMIIIDYGDLLRPISYGKEKRFDLESVFEDMRALAQEKCAAVYTASQTNRSSLNQEVITMESIAESFAKCFISDFILSLSRTIDDKNSNGGRIYVAKNRFGPDGIVFPILMDTAISKIDVLDSKNAAGELITDTSSSEAADVKNSHKERYKAVLKERKTKERKATTI